MTGGNLDPGLIMAPYKTIITKVIVSDENGTKSYWQINKWQRLKLFIYRIFHKTRKI